MGTFIDNMKRLSDDINKLREKRAEFREELSNYTQKRKEEIRNFLRNLRSDLEGSRKYWNG